ncbi:immunoglobulin superfamily member 3 isoform X2 [Tachyglossus aculeatus]|uniref:immunoglobulin superfamily member 3 isoform X2 n=1 Tax=Tachyglossus aculeatus TaxID=9261 RepID=UPI0018F3537D|nr:immunoglobulin superfamily member 3 isoform X2 [Tachyglossus aculeatus]
MNRFPPELTTLLMLLLGLGPARAQRQVAIQEGPLYRTEGSHATIWCNVSGYEGPAEQGFQWSVYLPAAPEREVQVVSTLDPAFPYAIYAPRVRAGQISVQRLRGDHAVLHIARLQARDAGRYECHTPSTDAVYFGSYSAKTDLVVLPDSLQVSAAAPRALDRVEGDGLELRCDVATATVRHTHLSVGWFRQRPGQEPAEVLGLGRDFVLRPGPDFAGRQAAGQVRLDRLGETAVRLTVLGLRPADAGDFYCEAAEWIQDPDGTWFPMTRKRSERTAVRVQPTDREFGVRLETEKRLYVSGEPLELRCVLQAQRVADRHFAVSWALNGSLIAALGPNAVPELSPDLARREARGQLKVAKEADGVFLLKVFHARPEDSGKYNCRVVERQKTPTGEFVDGESHRPKNVPITVLPLKTSLSVDLASNASGVLEGDNLQLACSVRSPAARPRARFSVLWQLLDGQGRAAVVTGLDREGTVQPGPGYWERCGLGLVQTDQVQPGSFRLRVLGAVRADEGRYECHVTEWAHGPDGDWQVVGERKAATHVAVTALETGFAVTAVSRTPGVTYGATFDLQCIVKPSYPPWVPVAVGWRFQPAATTGFHDLVTFTREGGVQWGAGPRAAGFRSRTAVEKAAGAGPAGPGPVRLSVSRAGEAEAGQYQCEAQLWRRNYNRTWTRLALRTSNLLEIRVLRPVSRLQVSKARRSVTMVESGSLQLNCSVQAQTSPDSHFAVLWYVRQATGAGTAAGTDGRLILRAAPDSALELSAYAEERGLRGRVQFERRPAALPGALFALTLRRAAVGDSGGYYCRVEEWLPGPDGRGLYRLAEEASGQTEVTVKLPDARLKVLQAQGNVTVLERQRLQLGCTVVDRSSAQAQFSVRWLVGGPGQSRTVARLGRDASSRAGDRPGDPQEARLDSPAPGHYRLVIPAAGPRDAGAYACSVEEWLPGPDGRWYKRAEETSGTATVTVSRPEPALQVEAAAANATVPEDGPFRLDCAVLARSAGDSRLAVAWLALRPRRGSGRDEDPEEEDGGGGGGEERATVLSVRPDAVFGPEGGPWAGRLRFQRPSPTLYRLTVLRARPDDAGNYSCRVEEWLPDARDQWYLLAREESAPVGIRVLDAGSTLQSAVCANDALFYFVFFYPFPVFGLLVAALVLALVRGRHAGRKADGKNGVPLLWIKEPHLNYSPTCLEPPVLSIHPGTID